MTQVPMQRGILQAAEQAQVKLTWVLLTHGHFDHILAVRDIQKATGAKLAIHKDELWLLKKEILEGSIQTFGLSRRDDYEELTPDLLAEEGTEIAIGNLTATYLHTPGHTPAPAVFGLEMYYLPGIPCSVMNVDGATWKAETSEKCSNRSSA